MRDDIFTIERLHRLVELFNKVKEGQDITSDERKEFITLHRSFKALSKSLRLELLILSKCKSVVEGFESVDTVRDPRFKGIACCGDDYVPPTTPPVTSSNEVSITPSVPLCTLIRASGLFTVMDKDGKVIAKLDPDTLVYTTIDYTNGDTNEYKFSEDDKNYLKSVIEKYEDIDNMLSITAQNIGDSANDSNDVNNDDVDGADSADVASAKSPISTEQRTTRRWLILLGIYGVLFLVVLAFIIYATSYLLSYRRYR